MVIREKFDLNYLIMILRRRFWYAVLPFFLMMSAILVYSIKAPKVYKSSTLILIQPQEVPEHYVTPTVTSDVRYRLKSITEAILSRSRLEKIIIDYDLYPEARSAGSIYDAVEKMRQEIEISFRGTTNRESPPAFEIALQGRDPVKVRDVVAALGNIFLQENLEMRSKQAAGTSRFLERELEKLRDDLRNKEELVREFREQYMGFLPEQMQNNQQLLTQLQQQLDSINTALQNTEDRKILLQSQINKIDTMQVGGLGEAGESSGSYEELLPGSSLGDLRSKLHSLKSRYTDQHPDVVRLEAIVAKLEKAQKTAPSGSSSQGHSLSYPLSEAQQLVQVQKDDLITKLDLIDNEIKSLKKEKNRTTSMIEEYRDRIEKGPSVEQKFLDLRRDYEMASENYQSLLKKKLDAGLAEDLERTQKGEQFKIQDPANLPRKPFKPDIAKVLPIGFILALVIGFAIAYLREYLDHTFWSAKDLERALQLPVLTSVPIMLTDKERRWTVYKKALTVCVLMSMVTVLLYGLYVVLAQTSNVML